MQSFSICIFHNISWFNNCFQRFSVEYLFLLNPAMSVDLYGQFMTPPSTDAA